MKLRTKFLILFVGVTLLLLILSTVGGYFYVKEQSGRKLSAEMGGLVNSYAGQLQFWIAAKTQLLSMSAFSLGMTADNEAAMLPYLKQYQRDADITDLYVGLSDGRFFDGSGWVPPADFTARTRPWYTAAAKGNGLVFTSPYIDAMTKKYVTTAAISMKNADGTLHGVVAEDILLSVVTDKLKDAKVRGEGYAMLLSAEGEVLAYPDEAMLGKNLRENEQFREWAKDLFVADNGSKSVVANGSPAFVSYRKIPATGWVLALVVPESVLYQEYGILKFIPLAALLFLIGLAWFVAKVVSRPIEHLQVCMAKVESGDLSVRGEVRSMNANDEIGALTFSMNHSVAAIGSMVKDIYDSTAELQRSSNRLIDIATTVAANSEEMSAKTCSVNVTAGDIADTIENTAKNIVSANKNVNEIAGVTIELSKLAANSFRGAEQVSGEVKQVSGKIEEISASIGRVADSARDVSQSVERVVDAVDKISQSIIKVEDNCQHSISIAATAGSSSEQTNEIIKNLNTSSQEIGNIINIISSIAEQTNMLALNATIEAASAGEAGKGFAVVAAEIKDLAKRTGEATRQIRQQIEAMQSDMGEAVQATEKITKIIFETTDIINTIASSVSEQSRNVGAILQVTTDASDQVGLISKEIDDIAEHSHRAAASAIDAASSVKDVVGTAQLISDKSREIAGNTENAAQVMGDIAKAADEIAKGSRDITSSMQEIELASGDTATRATETSVAANDLSEMSDKLSTLVQRFTIR